MILFFAPHLNSTFEALSVVFPDVVDDSDFVFKRALFTFETKASRQNHEQEWRRGPNNNLIALMEYAGSADDRDDICDHGGNGIELRKSEPLNKA
jgi:hypothetical protein